MFVYPQWRGHRKNTCLSVPRAKPNPGSSSWQRETKWCRVHAVLRHREHGRVRQFSEAFLGVPCFGESKHIETTIAAATDDGRLTHILPSLNGAAARETRLTPSGKRGSTHVLRVTADAIVRFCRRMSIPASPTAPTRRRLHRLPCEAHTSRSFVDLNITCYFTVAWGHRVWTEPSCRRRPPPA